ncbi:MAG TPA: hypothetical protein VNO50_20310 [Pyrinomonadaceae bacterium]|nr:hypothetical protein [Pyrinomonadaceae bacterium]
MMLNFCRLPLFLLTLALTPLLVPSDLQAQPSGGKLPPEAGPVTTRAKHSSPPANASKKNVSAKSGATKATKNTSTRSVKSSMPAAGAIDGKWWTTGNGFGDSEVVFTQSGPNVSGVIRFADGRTGTIEGTFTGKKLNHRWSDSKGNGGSGWLELSWNNFLGGPWRNQQERNGSWTLVRLEGRWCFGGSRNRARTVTHDARGRLTSSPRTARLTRAVWKDRLSFWILTS